MAGMPRCPGVVPHDSTRGDDHGWFRRPWRRHPHRLRRLRHAGHRLLRRLCGHLHLLPRARGGAGGRCRRSPSHPHPDRRRVAAGMHAGMAFTYLRPERSTEPARALPGARAIVVGARSYRRAASRTSPPAPGTPQGRVARYAREDHYGALRAGLTVVAREIQAAGWRGRVLADDNALVDREAAYRAGIGWYGKNANLLLPGHGSWFVLGSVITDAPLDAADERVPEGCGTCTRCLDSCPTGAIVAGRLARHGRWYIPRRQARYLRRNALVVLGNVGDPRHPEVEGALRRALADADPLVRGHAVWAVRRLGRDDLLSEGEIGDDPDPLVRAELEAPVEVRDAVRPTPGRSL